MNIELLLNRDTQLIINGQRPKCGPNGWSTGDDERGGMTVSHDGKPLEIAGLQLVGFHLDITLEQLWECIDPETLTLRLANGIEITAEVLETKSGDPDAEEFEEVTLSDGTKQEIDECTIYLKAKGQSFI